jgi:hypothetical protein
MHLFPWTRRRARRQAIAEAQARQRADYDRAVRRITRQNDVGMSIWSSIGIGRDEIRAINADALHADEGAGTGDEDLTIDVATTWHDKIRFIISNDDDSVYVRTMLSIENAEQLRDYLGKALETARRERESAAREP